MSKRKTIIYWIATLWLGLGMVATGLLQLTQQKADGAVAPPGVDGIALLGYPVYLLTLIGTWKILGTIAILIPKYPLLKEWAYAGFFFLMSGAIYSHIATGNAATELLPALLLILLTIVSWYTRPMSRKIIPVYQ